MHKVWRGAVSVRGWQWVAALALLTGCVSVPIPAPPEPSATKEAVAPRKLLAVLPLDMSHTKGKLDADGQASLEEMLRDVTANTLTGKGWTVLTGETTLQVLVDSGVDPSKCGDESCHLGSARKLNVEKFISGGVQFVDAEFTASVRLIDTKTGRIIGSVDLEGKTVTELRKDWMAKANGFFAQAGMVGESAPVVVDNGDAEVTPAPVVETNGPRVKKNKVTEAVGALTVTAKPRDKVRLELVDPNGRKLTFGAPYETAKAVPGGWKATARASGYEEETQTFEVPPDDTTLIKFELKALGALTVTGAPVGAGVVVTGPGGFKDDGGLPWEASGLKRGTYQVKASRKGYADADETVEVTPGQTATVRVLLRKGATGGGAGMIAIPGGTFTMGSEDGDGNEKPLTRVTLSPYFMDRTEVSVAAYTACVDAGKCSAPDTDESCNRGVAGQENYPINCVDWTQAKTYCEAQGGRLPTEAEWEFAARGTDGRKYPWGNSEPDRSKALFYSTAGTAPVESYGTGASPYGLLNMAGNVWEWVEDAYAPYPGGSVSNYKQESGQHRVIRGGGWFSSSASDLRAANRDRVAPSNQNGLIGFRCARGAGS
jgi:formylglycine-generating enzyme required for sulfatase activity